MILTSGCFDGLHAGHVRYLEAAKALCSDDEVLVCAVAPDEYIRQAKHREPFWPQSDRVRAIEGLIAVDAAIEQTALTPAGLIRQHRPRLFVKGPDWDGRLPADVQVACKEVGTSIAYVDTPGLHVSEAIG